MARAADEGQGELAGAERGGLRPWPQGPQVPWKRRAAAGLQLPPAATGARPTRGEG